MATSKIMNNTDTGWQNLPPGTASSYDKATLNTAKYRKVNNNVYVNLYNNAEISAGWKNIGCLPSGACPSTKIFSSGSERWGAGYEVQIETDGNVYITSSTAYTFVSVIFSFPST